MIIAVEKLKTYYFEKKKTGIYQAPDLKIYIETLFNFSILKSDVLYRPF